LIGESGATQVLELASGYSLRGLDLTQTGTLHYVETDLRYVVTTKLELLEEVRRRHNIAPRPLHAVKVADALDLGQLEDAAAGFDRGRPLVILCEGLVGYLTREETGRLTRNIRSLLGEFTGGCWIVPDFAFKREMASLPPERIRLREAVTGITQRQLDASAFEDGDELAAFFHGAGFDMQVCSQVDKTTSFSTIAALDLSPAVIERMRAVLRVWLMTARGRRGTSETLTT
jgi:O-methyltransferase involved in polyketide biosynthesis